MVTESNSHSTYLTIKWKPVFICIASIILLSGCSSLSIESAKKLGAAGKTASVQNTANIFASDDEYKRAMDAEAFFHGYAGMDVPQKLSDDYDKIQQELQARKLVFVKLSAVYEAFSGLSSANAGAEAETAINGFGDAINGYAAALNKSPSISGSAKGIISKVSGIIATEIQKEKIREASILIRERLNKFTVLFQDLLVKTQMTSFKTALAQNRAAAIQLLWKKGLFDPSPLINQMGAEVGLKARKDAIKIVFDPNKPEVKNGLEKVIVDRFTRRIALIENGYDASVKAIKALTIKHDELEKGEKLNLVHLQQILAQLQSITDMLAPNS